MKWCNQIKCNWCVSLDIVYIFALTESFRYKPTTHEGPRMSDQWMMGFTEWNNHYNEYLRATYLFDADQYCEFSQYLNDISSLPQYLHCNVIYDI